MELEQEVLVEEPPGGLNPLLCTWTHALAFLGWLSLLENIQYCCQQEAILMSAEPHASCHNQASVKGTLHQRLNLEHCFSLARFNGLHVCTGFFDWRWQLPYSIVLSFFFYIFLLKNRFIQKSKVCLPERPRRSQPPPRSELTCCFLFVIPERLFCHQSPQREKKIVWFKATLFLNNHEI